VRSEAASVEQYGAEAPADHRAALDPISLYRAREGEVAAKEPGLGGLSVGKGCIRFRGQIDAGAVRLPHSTVADSGPVC
jgi:hypothetical protein